MGPGAGAIAGPIEGPGAGAGGKTALGEGGVLPSDAGERYIWGLGDLALGL